jgi:hypothetical protein
MPRGRPPNPTQILKLQGTYEPGRHGKRVDEKLDIPGHLAESSPDLTDAQTAAWRYAIEHAPRGLPKRIDRAILGLGRSRRSPSPRDGHANEA